jgi:hypothetical protein
VRLSSQVHCLELHPLLPGDLKLKKHVKEQEKGKTIVKNENHMKFKMEY